MIFKGETKVTILHLPSIGKAIGSWDTGNHKLTRWLAYSTERLLELHYEPIGTANLMEWED